MKDRIVECIPNVSEGRDGAVIEEIARAFRGEEGAALLHRDSNADANRTVFTLAGEPAALKRAVLSGLRKALGLIDMTRQKGAHPRIGAVDVVPFVPISGVALSDCVGLAREVASALGRDPGIPVYLYEAAATRPERRSLARLRRGEYEGLADRFHDPAWVPDHGPASFVPASGAAAVGARPVLVAWNISLDGPNLQAAKAMARELRESGDGRKAGLFRGLKCIGWLMEGYHCAQVSCNVTDIEAAPLAAVMEAARAVAARYGARVAGSELVGLCPLSVLRAAGEASGASGSDASLVEAAIRGLGLELHGPFRARERVLEWALEDALGEKSQP